MVYLFCEFSLPFHQVVHGVVIHWLAELCGYLVELGQKVHNFLYSFLYNLNDGLFRIHLWLLFQITYRISWCPDNLSLIVLLHACDYLQQGGFSASVQAYDADFGAVEE